MAAFERANDDSSWHAFTLTGSNFQSNQSQKQTDDWLALHSCNLQMSCPNCYLRIWLFRCVRGPNEFTSILFVNYFKECIDCKSSCWIVFEYEALINIWIRSEMSAMTEPRLLEKLRRCSSTICLGLVFVLVFPIMGRTEITLGTKTFRYSAATPLANPVRVSAGIRSVRFVGKVGGVAFGGTAIGRNDEEVFALEYDSKQNDGERLLVTLRDRFGEKETFTLPVYDWMLVPIANFAATDQDACFTLFGDLEDNDEGKQLRQSGHRILNYHSAFRDTLVGLRLYQADILIIDPDAIDLPKEDGKYLLGNGESEPNVPQNARRFLKVSSKTESLAELHGGAFQSYVICDVDQVITFYGHEGLLVMTGTPVWSCWRYRKVSDDELDRIYVDISEKSRKRLLEEAQAYLKEHGESKMRMKWTRAYIDERRDEINDELESEALLEQMPQFSQSLTETIGKEKGVNPAVFNVLTKTMRISALFRHFRSKNADAFRAFLQSISHVPVRPKVTVPTVVSDE